MNTLLLQSTVPKQNTRKYTMAIFTERIEMAHKLGIELNVGRIDKLTTDNGTKEYAYANAQFLSILRQQNQQQK